MAQLTAGENKQGLSLIVRRKHEPLEYLFKIQLDIITTERGPFVPWSLNAQDTPHQNQPIAYAFHLDFRLLQPGNHQKTKPVLTRTRKRLVLICNPTTKANSLWEANPRHANNSRGRPSKIPTSQDEHIGRDHLLVSHLFARQLLGLPSIKTILRFSRSSQSQVCLTSYLIRYWVLLIGTKIGSGPPVQRRFIAL